MHIEIVPNRGSKPCILLRESYRLGGKVRKRTLANLSKLLPAAIDGLRILLRGGSTVGDLAQSFEVAQSRPYGNVAAVLETLRQLGLEGDLDPRRSRERDLVVAMIVARILEPRLQAPDRPRLGRGGSAEHRGRRARPGGGGRRATLRRHGLASSCDRAAWNSDWPAGTSTTGAWCSMT